MTTLEAQHEVITNLILENKKLMQERDEARNKMADALQEVDLRTLDFERMNQECYELRKELEEYRSIAENIGALKAVSEKEKAIRERDEAREALMKIEEIFIDGEDTYEDWKKMGNIARAALEK
jgi:hypothetical protein